MVKHNRSGGSQMRIIRYDPEMKALVWNSKRYMKKGNVTRQPKARNREGRGSNERLFASGIPDEEREIKEACQ